MPAPVAAQFHFGCVFTVRGAEGLSPAWSVLARPVKDWRLCRARHNRHTYASLLINNGENIKYIAEQMGHASVQITLDRYGHLFPSVRREAVLRLEKSLFPPKLDVLLNAKAEGDKAEPDGQDDARPGRVEEDVAPWPDLPTSG